MNLIFKVVILFLIVFNFRIPGLYNSVFLAMIIATFYYLFVRKSISFTYFRLRYSTTILIATLCMSFLSLVITVMHQEWELLFMKRFLIIFQMFITLVYIYPILIEDESKAFEEAITLLCYAFALQGLIHLSGFIYEPMGEFVIKFHEKLQEGKNPTVERFRLYALSGSIFFELPAAYGAVCILFFRLQLNKFQQYITGYKSYIIMALMLIGIILSGRTGFVGFFIACLFYLICSFDRLQSIWKNVWQLSIAGLVLTCVFYFLLPAKTQQSFVEDVFPFAFEAFYSYEDKGEVSTRSTDALKKYHYFYLADDILLKGEGVDSYGSRRHGGSDSGYMKLLIFGGIPFLICMVIYQCFYFTRILSISKRGPAKEDQRNFLCFLSLFLYIFILTYKESALGTTLMVQIVYFFTGSAYLIKHYAIEEQAEGTDAAIAP